MFHEYFGDLSPWSENKLESLSTPLRKKILLSLLIKSNYLVCFKFPLMASIMTSILNNQCFTQR